jgi:hypothetical protein
MGGLGITPQKPDLIDTFERMLSTVGEMNKNIHPGF